MLKRSAIAALAIAVVAIAVVPLLIDQPSGSQTTRSLTVAYRLRQWSPLVTLAGVAALAWIAAAGWRQSSRNGRAGFALALTAAVASAWFARQNPFEMMFRPLRNAAYVGASDASFVAADDMVLAVTIAADAAAYPIRQLAYHHVVNDTVGGVPAVVTY